MGVQWYNIYISPVEDDQFNLLMVILMMIFDAFIYAIIAWYIENAFPGEIYVFLSTSAITCIFSCTILYVLYVFESVMIQHIYNVMIAVLVILILSYNIYNVMIAVLVILIFSYNIYNVMNAVLVILIFSYNIYNVMIAVLVILTDSLITQF